MKNNFNFSKRQGANHTIKYQQYSNTTGNNNYQTNAAFTVARTKFNEVLKQYSFIRVIEINNLPKTNTKHEFYFGKGEVLSNFRDEKKQKFVFFDKAGRNKRETLNIGPCKLVDSAWGKEHISSKVDIGDILIGVLVQNQRQSANIDKVLTNWSKNGKIVMEFARLIEFGTKYKIHEISHLLLQNSCELALQAQSFPSSFFFNDMGGYVTKQSLQFISKCKDDFYFAIKIILWGELKDLAILHMIENPELGIQCKIPPTHQEIEICKNIRISETSLNFITLLSSKLEDFSILSKFYEFFDEISYPQKSLPSYTFQDSQDCVQEQIAFGNKTPEYIDDQKNYEKSKDFSSNFSPPSPDYMPSSPISPKYFPSSPTDNKNQQKFEENQTDKFPSSPPQSPQSPLLSPKSNFEKSPKYVPQSPKIIMNTDLTVKKEKKTRKTKNLDESILLVKKTKKNKNIE